MTTSEHADYTPTIADVRDMYIGRQALTWDKDVEFHGAAFDRMIAALASTPSPAQPTEASEREQLRWLCHTAGLNADGDADGDILADAILAAGFRLAPSPPQPRLGYSADDCPFCSGGYENGRIGPHSHRVGPAAVTRRAETTRHRATAMTRRHMEDTR